MNAIYFKEGIRPYQKISEYGVFGLEEAHSDLSSIPAFTISERIGGRGPYLNHIGTMATYCPCPKKNPLAFVNLIIMNSAILKLLDQENHGAYGASLLDERWKRKRKEILVRDNHRCVNCMSREKLQVHHRQYHFQIKLRKFKEPWDYPLSLMITLCESCHRRGHQLYKVPSIVI